MSNNGAIDCVSKVGRGEPRENEFKVNPETNWQERLKKGSIHSFAAQNPNFNIQTSGASIW